MSRNRIVMLAAVVLVFLGVGGYLAYRATGGGGQAVTVNLSVTGSRISPDSPSVKHNDRVTMTITGDKKEEIHLHGYDIHFEIPGAGQSVTHTFTADKTGPFEIEIESGAIHLTDFTVNP